MKTKPKKKTVTAWAWAVVFDSGNDRVDVASSESQAEYARATRYPYDLVGKVKLGPVTRIELPLPKEKKR